MLLTLGCSAKQYSDLKLDNEISIKAQGSIFLGLILNNTTAGFSCTFKILKGNFSVAEFQTVQPEGQYFSESKNFWDTTNIDTRFKYMHMYVYLEIQPYMVVIEAINSFHFINSNSRISK